MGRIDFFLGVLFLSLLLAPSPGFAHAPDGSANALTGAVFAEGSNQRIAHATVLLCDDGGNVLQEISASDSGEFSFQRLRPRHYILKVQAISYEPEELHIDLSIASERGLSVQLKPARPAGLPYPDGGIISAHELAMPEAARALLLSGKKKLYTEKNARAALLDFQSATARAPAYYEAHYQTGMAYLSLQNPQEAERCFRRSVEISQKKFADADIALGALLLHRNELSEGEALLRQGLASNPHSWPGQFELGELELSRGRLEPASAAAETAKSLAPKQPVVYRLLAVIHLREKNYPALLTDLDAYLQLDPDSPAGVRAKELRAEAERQLAGSQGAAVPVKK